MNVLNNGSLSGEIEIDETFVGSKNRDWCVGKNVKNSQSGSFKDKIKVFRMLQRSSNVIVKVVDDINLRH